MKHMIAKYVQERTNLSLPSSIFNLDIREKHAALDSHQFGSEGVILDNMALFNVAQKVKQRRPDHLINLHTP